jgi:adenosylcobinamide-GDP ribazoletransferase
MVPMLARASIPLLFLTTPYVRPGGLGSALSSHAKRLPNAVALGIVSAITIYLTGMVGILVMTAMIATFVVLRIMMQRRLGGMTGDTAGALIEISEAAMLIVLALSYA